VGAFDSGSPSTTLDDEQGERREGLDDYDGDDALGEVETMNL
jgi:hypothetical protein